MRFRPVCLGRYYFHCPLGQTGWHDFQATEGTRYDPKQRYVTPEGISYDDSTGRIRIRLNPILGAYQPGYLFHAASHAVFDWLEVVQPKVAKEIQTWAQSIGESNADEAFARAMALEHSLSGHTDLPRSIVAQ